MSIEGMSNIVVIAENEFSSQEVKSGGRSSLDRDAFLELLVTQLENQDPLNAMDDKKFIAQLAQFSSLEQMTNVSEGIDKMIKQDSKQQMLSSVNYIGHQVRAEGDTLSKEGQNISTLYYSIEDTAANVHANIFDQNGNIVRTLQLGGKQAGEYEMHWDGKNYQGEKLPDGVYTVSMAAEGVNGEPVLINKDVNGKVAGVSTENGDTKLRLKDGREVDLLQVKEIVSPKTSDQG